MNILLINYGTSNINSIYNALKKVKKIKVFINNFEKKHYDKIIFPGQGHITNCIKFLSKIYYLKNYLSNSYILGICIGYHIFFKKSIENEKINCLNIINENIDLIAKNCCYNTSNPNINWNNVNIIKNHKIFKKLPLNFKQYFMHSYSSIFKNQKFSYATSIFNNIIFNSIIIKENKFLFQFHPEKSSKIGLLLLNNFLNL
ncbi:imidazole glycerol phosphate synthase subunit HisH [Candidatus Carsonella ruddii]|uniref:Imidazole glycerol phosphate synthase subunit HisH n=1 Tax=Carsonella ruddii TaxID=114186 RepID=A0A2K8K4G9_CARRU|nr:imidazole glycerol phosphate synthase subunit HisH [Candidatus Carsonella ruddii]ATX33500.1 imidazole glycerol phosphate synthase subunit HisH [Candidatus Carsonella ruddii]